LIVTAVERAELLAAICKLSSLRCLAVPTAAGAVAVLKSPDEVSSEAAGIALSGSLGDVLALRRGPSDDPAASDIQAVPYHGGVAGEAAAPGLILANLPEAIEDLLLGVSQAPDLDGTIDSDRLSRLKAAKWLHNAAKSARTKQSKPGQPPTRGEP
jgi:hypothetical protein